MLTTSSLNDQQLTIYSSSYVNSPIIRVVVGTTIDQDEFFVHEDLICPRNEFFRKAMNGQWKESEKRMVPLPEDEAAVFSLYLKLLYVSTWYPLMQHSL